MSPKNDYVTRLAIVAIVIMYLFGGSITQLIADGVFTPISIEDIAGDKPEDTTRFTVRFNSLNGEILDDPIYIDASDTYDLLPEGTRMGELKLLVSRLGSAYIKGDVTKGEELNGVLRTYLTGFQSADYDIVLRVFNPVERFTMDGFVIDNVLASFEYRNTPNLN